ncbi:MAG: hypothetical protein AB1400_07600 [Pseudomonadota bacterium]
MNKSNFVLGVSVATLAACGGGGGGGGGGALSVVRPTVITGSVTPPATVGNGVWSNPPGAPLTPPGTVGNVPPTTILTPPNTTQTWDAVSQSASYSFDPVAARANPSMLKATSMHLWPVDTTMGSLSITTGAANPADPATGQPASMLVSGFMGSNGAPALQSRMAGMPAAVFVNTAQASVMGYVLPYSAVLNPAGYVYQTFGSWFAQQPGSFTEAYFSAGVVSNPATLPVAGTASYSGAAGGTWVNAATRDLHDTVATMNATADFGARTVAFSTTGTTSLSVNAPAGAAPTANPGLNLNGTLSYAAGNSTFTGTVSTVSGMTGNATGRFYGPGIVSATANQVLGAPPEIGGTFAVMTPGVGAMQGAFGGSGSHPPTVVVVTPVPPVPASPIPAQTTITGAVTPPVAPFPGATNGVPNMLTPVNSVNSTDAIVQQMNYTLYANPAAATPPPQMVTTLNLSPVDSIGMFSLQTGPTAYPLDPALGQASALTAASNGLGTQWSTANGQVLTQSVMAGLPTAVFTNTAVSSSVSYVLPYSVTMNPAGYTYQTFGSWNTVNAFGHQEFYFSAGIPTVAATLPVAGTATYTGVAAGSYVNAVTLDPSKTTATMNATADFAARTVAFSTTGTASLSNNAPVGTAATANAGLNMTGTLTYAAGSNTFTGAVTTANGMSGNATGRFYGPGVAVATPTKAVGAPPEIGGTFAVMAPGVGAMQGAFGGK